ncbi:MAG TPA: sugar phosphate isomerase/epimerase [Blastocatellia bacterium]|nr:sugar phosphate isomerase/epimerase [Blastocatellia bacterium]HMV86083.1 sugar phosphate isomerase/epimerase [Blastocatellia bacterium]HMY76528.1 sugar phosphate isomerase/epimerase [Blastocatellia bacterium]HMZ22521.1 sugar phosphate isomerase/epimerase [Blastocatellia bacterium]HNG31971.1 sugar phosphate isomerase/epimerase [Blastocatellia bacterium]
MLTLGIVADEISRDFREAARIGLLAGLRRYEIRFLKSGRAPMCDPAELREIESIRDGEGLELTALSPGLFKWTDSPEKFRREMEEVFPRAVELAKRWNLSALIVFGFCKPGAKEENADLISSDDPPAWVIDSLAEAGAKAEEVGLRLLIEAEPVCWADTGAATANLIRRAGGAAIGVNYDPCNVAWMTRRDPMDEFALIAPFIANVHVKDQLDAPRGSGLPTWVVPGEGLIDYRPHFAALKQIGYAGPVSLEPHMDGSLETIRACKDAVERLWQAS